MSSETKSLAGIQLHYRPALCGVQLQGHQAVCRCMLYSAQTMLLTLQQVQVQAIMCRVYLLGNRHARVATFTMALLKGMQPYKGNFTCENKVTGMCIAGVV